MNVSLREIDVTQPGRLTRVDQPIDSFRQGLQFSVCADAPASPLNIVPSDQPAIVIRY